MKLFSTFKYLQSTLSLIRLDTLGGMEFWQNWEKIMDDGH